MANILVIISLTIVLSLGLLCEFVLSQAQSSPVPEQCVYTGKHLDCSRRKLKDVPKIFPPDVVAIDFSWNKLESVNVSVFANLTRLLMVKFSHNRLKSIPIIKSNNVTDLMLDHNDIAVLDLAVFTSLPNLRLLDMNSNKLGALPSRFPNNTLLRVLYLNNNRIGTIPPGCLDGLTQLEVLRMNRNRLKTLSKTAFNKVTKLQTLELMRNELQKIDALSFQSLAELKTLKLRKNKIHQLADGAFWGLSTVEVLKLDYNNISSVERRWLYGLETVQILTLSHNAINRVESEGWKFCPKLRQLDLRHNQLTKIETENFSQLSNLHILNLDHNHIRDIEISAFVGLTSLLSLHINYNEVRWNVEDMNGAFNGLTSLAKLGLRRNHITTIAVNAFVDLTRLRSLDVARNPLASVQKNAFAQMTSLLELRINSSALMCDCNLGWLPIWLKEKKFDTHSAGICAHPAGLNGKDMYQVLPGEFKCDDVPKPVIISSPQSHVAIRGLDTRLECTVASSSNTPMKFQWRKDGVAIKDADVENVAQSDASMLTNSTTILHLKSVGDSAEGSYQCVVTNQFGSTYSHKARITVHVLPSFTQRPVNVTVRAGETARLECSATGHPTPQIVWQKDGGDDFPAAQERRMHVMPTDVVFFIVKVKAADSGVYSCIAESLAGRIVANATVSVLEEPSFVETMVDKQVRLQETAVLECLASGSPRPRLTWYKDDRPMVVTPRHFFTADGQLLIIVQTKYSDAGKYTCEMSNTLSTKSDWCELEILPAAGAPPFMASLSDQSTMIGIIIIAVVCCVVGTSLVWVIIIYQTRKKTEEAYTPTPTDEVTIPMDLPSSSADSYPSLEKRSSRMSIHLPEHVPGLPQHPIYSLSAMNLTQHLASEVTDDSHQPFLRSSWLDGHKLPTAVGAPIGGAPLHPYPATVALVHSNGGFHGGSDSHGGSHEDFSPADDQYAPHRHDCGYDGVGTPAPVEEDGDFCEGCAMLRDATVPSTADSPTLRQSTLRRNKPANGNVNDNGNQPVHDDDDDDDDTSDVNTPLRTLDNDVDVVGSGITTAVTNDVGDGDDDPPPYVDVAGTNNNVSDAKAVATQNGNLVMQRKFDAPASHRTIV